MPVTNEEIMEKLNRIEAMLSMITKEEEEELKEEKIIEQEEEKELKAISDSNINLEYPNIEDWRKYIWEGCEHKEERSESGEIEFWCRKQDKICRFEGCPLNIKTG
ncbi:hypothetical protein KY363_05405 [Candidatus Woesearchaeota archaeon]|nr:hypothetical protein [Candidatus Woesearchaeota archaeon]